MKHTNQKNHLLRSQYVNVQKLLKYIKWIGKQIEMEIPSLFHRKPSINAVIKRRKPHQGSVKPVGNYLVHSRSGLQNRLDVVLAVRVDIKLSDTVERRPLGLILEEAHSLDVL